ncbi:MAG: Gfo/Idh/MocA family oxidoreductase [Lewinellaceae bacterium]|nr:Gfo/Idh/MocA family oxidoreductase [Lewinellaceae bacterium]
MARSKSTRRKFLRQIGASSFLLSTAALSDLAAQETYERHVLEAPKRISANDKVRIALIGAGIQGHNDLQTALKVPGVELAAACDLYTGRLERLRELHGKDLFVTRDYREILERSDIDAVILATADHWHARIAVDALKKGKHIYCEKPMVQKIKEGLPLVKAWRESGRTMQVGSQGISGLHTQKARELFQAGEIGRINCIEATYDRQSALGAWQYTMPTDGSPETVDWDRYIAGMPKSPYDPKKFFWWRNYREFGTGVAGDLFVHLLTSIHAITGSYGPTMIASTAELSYWKDGRNVPDVMVAVMNYPETPNHPQFQLMIRVNFAAGTGGKNQIRFIGDEGFMEYSGGGVKVQHNIMPKAPGIGGWDALSTYPEAMQQELMKKYNETWSEADRKTPEKPPVEYVVPQGHNPNLEHMNNFMDGVRMNKPVIENPEVGFRAAAPSIACNDSYFKNRIIHWDPVAMKVGK